MIHVVERGQTLYSIAAGYGVDAQLLAAENGLTDPQRLVVGQSLLVLRPEMMITAPQQTTLSDLAAAYSVSRRYLQRLNPWLLGGDVVPAGSRVVVAYEEQAQQPFVVNGYSYQFVDRVLLRTVAPCLTALLPFTYGFTAAGDLVALDDDELLRINAAAGAQALLVLAPLDDQGRFNNDIISAMLYDEAARETLLVQVLAAVESHGYAGVDLDFEYVKQADGDEYAAFAAELARLLHAQGKILSVALAPKYYAEQRGVLYEGHDYQLLGQAADLTLLMTYEWGYTFGPPMAVAPLYEVERVLDYGLSEIPAEKILMGLPNYGYDWTLPQQPGRAAISISNPQAVALAWEYNVEISFDQAAATPYFRYRTAEGLEHEVWFEDIRSVTAKLDLAQSKGLAGVSYWTIVRPFVANWLLVATRFAPTPLPAPSAT